jgi:glucose/mannose-6-phosphate isomerase
MIQDLPDQLLAGWQLANRLDLPEWAGFRQVLFVGLGGSAIGADLLAAYAQEKCMLPLILHRDYALPGWARGSETLVVVSSYSGNTEESISAFEQALANGCRCLVVSKGGELGRLALEHSVPWWKYEHEGQPRSAVGLSFSLLLAMLARLKLIQVCQDDLLAAVDAMRRQEVNLGRQVPAARNPAKRMAGQMMDRWVVIFGSGLLAPVARRWKAQINELSKAMAQFETLPEADHNTLAGTSYPEELISKTLALFLRAPSDAPRHRLRTDLTRQTFMVQGFNTDFIDAQGVSPLAYQWTSLHFGDYIAYYLALAYGADPTPVPMLDTLKEEMSRNKSLGNLVI